MLVIVAFIYLPYPFTNAFEIWSPRCIKCQYDMRGTDGPCPECGGEAEVFKEH